MLPDKEQREVALAYDVCETRRLQYWAGGDAYVRMYRRHYEEMEEQDIWYESRQASAYQAGDWRSAIEEAPVDEPYYLGVAEWDRVQQIRESFADTLNLIWASARVEEMKAETEAIKTDIFDRICQMFDVPAELLVNPVVAAPFITAYGWIGGGDAK